MEIAGNIWQATINQQQQQQHSTTNDTHHTASDTQNNSINYEKIIQDQKKEFLLILNETNQEKCCLLSNKYSQLNIDLLMNIIESRQKILIQRMEFESDLNEIVPTTNHVAVNTNESSHEKNTGVHE